MDPMVAEHKVAHHKQQNLHFVSEVLFDKTEALVVNNRVKRKYVGLELFAAEVNSRVEGYVYNHASEESVE